MMKAKDPGSETAVTLTSSKILPVVSCPPSSDVKVNVDSVDRAVKV